MPEMNDEETQRAIGRIEGTLATNTIILADIRKDLIRHFEDDKETFSKIGERLGAVEKKVWYFSGIGAAIAFIAAKFTGKV